MFDTLSVPCTVKIGIPQGTVLGPSLFNLYIRSITDLDIKGVIISYADDTVVVFDGESWEQTKHKTENGISIVKDWLDASKLTLNI